MKRMRLLGASLIVALALGAMNSSTAAAKKVLVLKEKGQPVALNAELQVELEQGVTCVLIWQAHLLANDAKSDKIAVEPTERECNTAPPYPEYLWGKTDEVELTSTGKATIRGQWRHRFEQGRPGPECEDQFAQLKGRLRTPGPTEILTAGRFTLVTGEQGCRRRGTTDKNVRIRGHNGKLLEAEVVG